MSSIKISEEEFGTHPEGQSRIFTLSNKNGMKLKVMNYGATIHSLLVPDASGHLHDVVLGFDNIDGYISKENRYFGSTIGRVCNRTSKGQFTVDGKNYKLSINNGPNHLHGGIKGFDKNFWTTEVENGLLKLSYFSPDGEEGYPGNVQVKVSFELTEDNQLIIEYEAKTDASTPINLTNHSYFNLSGDKSANKNLENHLVYINADNFTPTDDNLIPTGEITSVDGTKYDFRTIQNIESLLEGFPPGNNGYDINFCLNKSNANSGVNLAARVQNVENGIILEVHTDQPGVQFYTSNFLPDKDQGQGPIKGKNGHEYWKHGAFCLETQNYPNAVNQDNFPNSVIKPEMTYRTKTIYQFYTLNKSSIPIPNKPDKPICI